MITHVPSAERSDPRSSRRLALLATLAAVACLAFGAPLPSAAGATTPFGITSFTTSVTNQDGTPATQAGSHPYELTTSIAFTQQSGPFGPEANENVKDIQVALPPGLLGNPNATPECTRAELDGNSFQPQCPNASQVGLLQITAASGPGAELPLYNLVPPAGEPAQFAANLGGTGIDAFLDFGVRTGSDYGITSTTASIPTLAAALGVRVTLWGVPADPSHDDQRCAAAEDESGICEGSPGTQFGPNQSGGPDTPLLTMPTSCGGPLNATVSADSWQSEGDFVSTSSTMPAITGCDRLQFNPSISVQTDTTSADSPSGLNVDLSIPQDGMSDPTGLAEAGRDV